MGKKGRRCKTRWRRLPMGGEEEEDCTALGGREKGGGTSPNKVPYKGGGQRGKGTIRCRNGGAVTDGNKKGATGSASFNEDEYTKITTPRQDVLFKKGYLMARKKDVPPPSTETSNGDVPVNGDASSSSDQTYSAQVSGSGEEEGYAYVNSNGYSYGGPYHMDHTGVNGGNYFVNGGSYEIYDPYAAAGYAFQYVGAPPHPPHTMPPLQAMDWYASRPFGSTANVGDIQWCHLVTNPGYSDTRRKRYSTDSQNCSPPSSESTGPPGSPQEEGGSSGDQTHQPIPQYHHAHVFHPPQAAAAYVYPGYLFGPPVYSVNGLPFPPVHTLHGISAAPPVPTAQTSDSGSQRRKKKKRRRKRRRGLTDEASGETSSGEEDGTTCGGEEYDGEDGPVVVVRLGNVGPLMMNQPQQFAEGEREASSTDCSELSGQPESSAEESGPVEEEDGVPKPDPSAEGDVLPHETIAEKDASTETKEVSTQSPPEMAVQVDVSIASLPPPSTPLRPLTEMTKENDVIDKDMIEIKEEKDESLPKEEESEWKEIVKQKKRNGRGKNGNKQPSPVAIVTPEKTLKDELDSVYIEKTEALEPILTPSNLADSKVFSVPVVEVISNVHESKGEIPLESVEDKSDIFPVISIPDPEVPEMKDSFNTEKQIIVEQKSEQPIDLDSIAFKPELYKQPMPSKPERKEEPILSEDNILPKEVTVETSEVEDEENSLSRHLEDMPRRRTRLKEPPEKAPEIQVLTLTDENEKSPELEEKNIISLETNEVEIDDNSLRSENTPAEVIEQPETEDLEDETLTEVVSKWLVENTDAFGNTTKEIIEKTEDEEETEEENLTGSKNGVGNPFPAPSSRFLETTTSYEHECVNVNERKCELNASAISRDGPVKRVANREIGEVHENKDTYDNDRQSEDSDKSCEWEPMTVEAPKKNFGDLETWKRLRSCMGGSSEAIRSLGSYRGTDDEEEDERRKARESMCDPNTSVAKYYCLGSRDTNSASPEEGLALSEIPVQTDSGVQSDVEDDSVATAEEAFEESMAKGKTVHRGMGLEKTAAFVVRQIGTTDTARGPFPCGICCIIQ